jgi:hypothetical protein
MQIRFLCQLLEYMLIFLIFHIRHILFATRRHVNVTGIKAILLQNDNQLCHYVIL